MLRRKFTSHSDNTTSERHTSGRAISEKALERREALRQAAKLARQQAYQKAKERRASDPRYLALKEAAKVRRREHYARVKEHRKAAQVAERAARSAERAQVESAERSFFRQRRSIDPKKLQQALEEATTSAPQNELGMGELGMGDVLAASVEVANDVH